METPTNEISAAEQAVLNEARKVNDERMQAVKDLAMIVAERIDLEEQLKDNTKQERRAVRAAEKAGWTQAQIKRFMKPPRSSPASKKPTPSSTRSPSSTQEVST